MASIMIFLGCDVNDSGSSSGSSLLAALSNDQETSTPDVPAGRDDTGFYTPPSSLPAGRHGDIIKYQEAQVTIAGAPDFKAWNVMYYSTDALGAPNIVTGTVLVPKKSWSIFSSRPIIAYAVGTHGLCHACAPSAQLAAGTDYENENLAQALGRNYAVVVTDNPGYTIDAVPTYMSGKAQGHALLDIVTAASKIPSACLSARAKVAIWGYSQGGQTAAWAGELQPGYAPGLRLAGVAAGGVPADFFGVAPYLDGKNGSA
ncbi:MAG TPA: lipase family protein, partial [Spirochaetota bacterium]|nr:lipase family protein [Spirochaetota bacterium]